jgi:monothiol glutaredoxin
MRSVSMSRDVMNEIQHEVRENPVVLYMKGTRAMPQCGFSAAVLRVLLEIGIDFQEVDILSDSGKRDAIKVFSDWPTIPQLYVGGEFIGGRDIVREMHAKGELEPLLRTAAGTA